MDPRFCAECRAIYRELRDAWEAADGRPADPRRIAEFLQQLDEQECARMRLSSDLWRTWRRLMRHRALTGHSVSLLPIRPEAIANPN